MANPQKENGYTPISNELLDAIISFGFVATHYKIVFCCLRYSYGFSRKEAELSESFLSKATKISKRYISQELNNLISMKVITVTKESTYSSSRIICINKNYEEWESRTTVQQSNHSSTVDPEQDTTVEPEFNTTVEPEFHQDKQNIKQNIKQTSIDAFFEKAWKLYPRKEGKGSVSKTQKKKIYDLGDEFIRCIERYIQKRVGEDQKYTQMGSTFFKSGYVDYLDVNYGQNGYSQPTLFPTNSQTKKNEPMKPQVVNYKSDD